MIEEELMNIWQSSSKQERLKFEKSKLILELQSSLGRLNRWWKYLERINIVSALICIPVFLFAVYWAPYTLMKIGSVLVVCWCIYVAVRMSGVKKFKPNDLEDNYLQYLEKTRTYLLAQKKILETPLNWQTLTLYPIIILFFIDLWEKPLARYLGVGAFLALVGVGIYEHFRSKRRVRHEINPRIASVEALIKELKG